MEVLYVKTEDDDNDYIGNQIDNIVCNQLESPNTNSNQLDYSILQTSQQSNPESNSSNDCHSTINKKISKISNDNNFAVIKRRYEEFNIVEPELNADKNMNNSNEKKLCLVCGDIASGSHYGVASCEACKAFFKRTIQGSIVYICPAENVCEINKRRRKACQACRFQKCINKGMIKEAVRLDRSRGGRQKYRRSETINEQNSWDSSQQTTQHGQSTSPNTIYIATSLLDTLILIEPTPSVIKVPTNYRNSSVTMLNIISDIHDKELIRIISWAKEVPGFAELEIHNQMKMLQSTWTEILILTICYNSTLCLNEIQLAMNFTINEESAHECGMNELYHYFLLVVSKLQHNFVSRDEYLLLKPLLLANADVKLEESSILQQFRNGLLQSLSDCVAKNSNSPRDISKLLLCLPIFRTGDCLLRRFWNTILDSGDVEMKRLFLEMLNPVIK